MTTNMANNMFKLKIDPNLVQKLFKMLFWYVTNAAFVMSKTAFQ